MAKLGIPVPPGFTITTAVCKTWQLAVKEPAHSFKAWFDGLMAEVQHHDSWLAAEFDAVPPLVSVRSGAPVSMPGMMNTILNVGLTLDTMVAWEKRIGQRTAWDSYRRLIQMLGETAYGVDIGKFEFHLAKARKDAGVKEDWQLDVGQLQKLVNRYRLVFEQNAKQPFPDTREAQLRAAISAVFRSWDKPRAIEYRKINKIDEGMGTAVNVQAMVFGNMGEDSGSGVLFSRNPSTGMKYVLGEFLQNAQGEDVVAGIRTPLPLEAMNKLWPALCQELLDFTERLEAHCRDMMDLEFTIQQGKLWLLQCRVGKRTALAAFRIARQFADEELINRGEALGRLTRAQYKVVRQPRIDPAFKVPPHATGKGASPGIAVGRAVFSAAHALNCVEPCILVTKETNPDDIAGMAKAAGILTQTGGSTSHAAVVARSMDKPCVVGCTDLVEDGAFWSVAGGPAFDQSSTLTIDGDTGRVWIGVEVPVVSAADDADVQTISRWAVEETGRAVQVGAHPPGGMESRVMAADFWGGTAMLASVLDEIAKIGPELVTLDLTPPADFAETDDALLLNAFGAPLEGYDTNDFWVPVLDELRGRAVALKGMTLMCPGYIDLADDLANTAYRFCTRPKTLGDLLFADAVVLTDDFVTKVIGGAKALAELKVVLTVAQRTVHVMPPAVPMEYAVFTALAA
jgi:pyruvate,orthophosphate dikinase